MNRSLIAATVFAGLIVLAGCSGGDTADTATSSVTTTTPTTNPGQAMTPPTSVTSARTPATEVVVQTGTAELPGSADEICVQLKPMFDIGRGYEGYDAEKAYDEFIAEMQSDQQAKSEWDAMTSSEQQRFLAGIRMAASGDC